MNTSAQYNTASNDPSEKTISPGPSQMKLYENKKILKERQNRFKQIEDKISKAESFAVIP